MRGIALSGQRVPKPEALVCQLSASPAARCRSQPIRSYASATKVAQRPQIGQCLSKKPVISPSVTRLPLQKYASTKADQAGTFDLDLQLHERNSAKLRDSESVPTNEAVVYVLQSYLNFVESLVQPNRAAKKKDNEISSLLDLDEKASNKARKPGNAQPLHPAALQVCRIAHDLLKDEKIFISPEALTLYVKIHALCKRPEFFPEIFHLYANKPIPEANSSPVKFLKPNPKSINSAVPVDAAYIALDAAIEQRDLSLVLAIIDNTFCTPAFHRAKFFKKAAAPLGLLTVTPLGCYAAASFAASFQNTMEPGTATAIAFAATLAYVGGTSSVGLLAIVTANDHMERVVWTPGVPLRERWLREEERAALDRVALAWGFKDIYMRGEEEGEEWESLKEFIGMRGMILDKTDLMAGMQ
ncbi:hypothetical protein BDV18DRAFT_132173 [Aspergillus unguis]